MTYKNSIIMIDCTTPEPIKSLVYACQSMLHWHDEFVTEQEWSALKNETSFLNRIRELVPQCIEILSQNPNLLDCE